MYRIVLGDIAEGGYPRHLRAHDKCCGGLAPIKAQSGVLAAVFLLPTGAAGLAWSIPGQGLAPNAAATAGSPRRRQGSLQHLCCLGASLIPESNQYLSLHLCDFFGEFFCSSSFAPSPPPGAHRRRVGERCMAADFLRLLVSITI